MIKVKESLQLLALVKTMVLRNLQVRKGSSLLQELASNWGAASPLSPTASAKGFGNPSFKEMCLVFHDDSISLVTCPYVVD